MKNSRIFLILTRVQYGHKSPKDAHDEILSLLGENTEGVSTSSRTESGVSHGVSDRNASRSDSTKDSEEVVGGTLALRTDDENIDLNEKFVHDTGRDKQEISSLKKDPWQKINMKSS